MTAPRIWPARTLEVAKIHPNPWNPNRMGREMRQKLRRGVEDAGLGILADLLVRPCQEHGGKDFEIVDGQHRWEIYREMGLERVEAKVADLSDDDAKMAGVILNELRGQPEVSALQALVRGLADSSGIERMSALLPWREDVVRRLAASADAQAGRQFAAAADAYEGRVPLTVFVSEGAWAALERIMAAWKLEDPGDAVGRALEEAAARAPKGKRGK